MQAMRLKYLSAAAAMAGVLSAVDAPAVAAGYGSDPIPFTPYGMDAVPNGRFYSHRWDRYGSDPVPAGRTNDFGFRDIYGLDAVPEAAIPSISTLKDVLPHEALQVLTGAIEGGDVGSRSTQSSPGDCPPCTKPAGKHRPTGR
jgi:hypothetical protein